MEVKTRRRWRPARDQLTQVRESVFRACGLRIRLDVLDDDEVAVLQQLVGEIEATAEEGVQRSDPVALNDVEKLKTWERLVAKSAGKPRDYFDRERERAAAAAAAANAAKQAKRHKTAWEPGATVVPAAVIRGVQDGDLPALHLLILTVVLAAIENMAGLHNYMRVEDDAVVVPGPEYLLSPLDEDGDIRHVAQGLKELAAAGVLTMERVGAEVRIRLGVTLREAL